MSNTDNWLEDHWDGLYSYALSRVRDEMLAEDLVQETLLAAFKNRRQFAQRSAERTWLVGILKHKIIDSFRKQSRESPNLNDDILSSHDTLTESYFDAKQHWQIHLNSWANPDNSLENDQFWKTLSQCIDQLPKRMADLFILKELEGLSSEELCKVANISTTNNLWVNLSRARMRMRECIGHHWFDASKEKSEHA